MHVRSSSNRMFREYVIPKILAKLARRCMPRNSTFMQRDNATYHEIGYSARVFALHRRYSAFTRFSIRLEERERTLRTHVHPMSLIFQDYRTARRCAAGSMHFARATRVCTAVMVWSANLRTVDPWQADCNDGLAAVKHFYIRHGRLSREENWEASF